MPRKEEAPKLVQNMWLYECATVSKLGIAWMMQHMRGGAKRGSIDGRKLVVSVYWYNVDFRRRVVFFSNCPHKMSRGGFHTSTALRVGRMFYKKLNVSWTTPIPKNF